VTTSESTADSIRRLTDRIDKGLNLLCEARYAGDDPVSRAARYAMQSGGKRTRPLLCLLTTEAVGGSVEDGLPAALAVEMIHTYSLVHDDLPCMDDDDLRRGRATTHKVHGEATALLAGDALLTDAFSLLSESGSAFGLGDNDVPDARRLAQVRELATAAGGLGMVLGQALDLHWTARGGYGKADLEKIHREKTGRLLAASSVLGAIAGNATKPQIEACRTFGSALGLAFQILDDLLDDTPATGKSQGKDRAAGKLTYLSLMTPAAARSEAALRTREAVDALRTAGLDAGALAEFAQALLSRKF
jgi:geranylgeranyl diphosphate synthase type II